MTKYCPYCVSPLEPGRPCSRCNFAAYYRPKLHHMRPGTILHQRYLVGRVLGEGGFGITYIGRDLTLDMKVAIKEYYPNQMATRDFTKTGTMVVSRSIGMEFTEGQQRFLTEAKTLASMVKEEAVVGVNDFFEENNSAYIIMEYVEGYDLKSIVKTQGKPAPPAELFELLKPVFTALDNLHGRGLIHRDISPDNIMIENGKARLIDFGCARGTINDPGSGAVLKHCFSPIEQYRDQNLGPWSDVYAMAATIYYCITGKLPPAATDRVISDEIVPPTTLGAKLTKKQEKALMKALAVMPENRYQSMQAFGKDLFVKPFPVKQAIIAGVAVVALVGAALWYVQTHKGDTVIETMKVANQTTEYVTLASNPSPEERELIEKVSETIRKTAVVSADSDNYGSGYYYRLNIKNESGSAIPYIRFSVNFYDDKGTLIGNSSCAIDNWEQNDTSSQSFYCRVTDPAQVKVRASFDHNEKTLQTDYLDVEYTADEENGSVIIELANELPVRIRSDSYNGKFTYEFTSFRFEASSSGRSNMYYAYVYLGGSLVSGSEFTDNYYGANYRLTGEDGTVYDSGTVDLPALNEGEKFENQRVYLSDLPAGRYTLELSDYSR